MAALINHSKLKICTSIQSSINVLWSLPYEQNNILRSTGYRNRVWLPRVSVDYAITNIDINTKRHNLTTMNTTTSSKTVIDANRISSQVKIKHCSYCPGTTEYYCHDCKGDLCRPCKEMHVDILDIKYHNVTVYTGKFNRHEKCTEHPDKVIEMFCEQCDIPVCSHCRKHQQHKQQNIRTAYQNKLLQFNYFLINISWQSIYNAHLILNELKSDFTACHKEMDQLKTAMVSMSKMLKKIIG